MRCSLIVSTYNWPKALELCLLSVKSQKVLPFEVLVADDGSKGDTMALVNEMAASFPVPLRHIWQEDLGFQVGKIRNKAIVAAKGDYIVQIDGDVILHPLFIKDHLSFAKKGTFVSGHRVLINEERSRELFDRKDFRVWKSSKGLQKKMNGFRNPLLCQVFVNQRKNRYQYVLGCNMGYWRADAIACNGYNEEITGWGKEDNEYACRLLNNGVQNRNMRYYGVVYHLYHRENDRSRFEQNHLITEETVKKGIKRCDVGISQYL